MKKILAVLFSIILAAGILPAAADEQAGKGLPEVPGSWADPENDRAAVDLLPAETASLDGPGKLVMQIMWSDSAWDEWVFTLVLVPEAGEENKVVYAYNNGTARLISYDDEGKKISETESGEALHGTVTAEADEQGETVLRLESGNESLPNLTLRRETMPVPSPEELAANVLEPILELEEDTAGAGMKTAVLASRLLKYAVEHRLYAADPVELTRSMQAALKDLDLSEEETREFREKKSRVTDLIRTILSLGDEPDGAKAAQASALLGDAGVLEEMDEVLDSSLSSAFSANRLLTGLEAAE